MVNPMTNFFRSLWQDESGQDLAEYGLLLGLLSMVAISSTHTIANAIGSAFSDAAGNLTVS
jgi:Flp pilus assembly pilin Flp